MKWKTEAVEKLRRYDAMCRATVNLPEQIRQLKGQASAISSGLSGQLPGSRNVRSREDRTLDNLVQRQELQWSLEQANLWVSSMNRALDALTAEERLILHQMYIRPPENALPRLCDRLGVEKTSIYRRRDKALEKFTVALYGAGESK